MSTLNMNPKNLIILGALGVAAYYFMTRRASAAPAPAVMPRQPNATMPYRPGQPGYAMPVERTGYEIGSTIGAIGQLWSTITQPAITRPPGYVPTYTPDNTGEVAARQYYLDNKDSFAVNPPDQYATYEQSYDGIDSR